MKTSNPTTPRGAATAVVALMVGASLAACAHRGVEPLAGERPLMTVAAHGVQIHECRAAAGAAPAWVFVAPQADLFDSAGRHIGSHGAGPSWSHADGSGFTGAVRARADAPQPGAIPWLLLSAQARGPDGAFARVSSVQRVNTVGGQPPAGGCTGDTLGQRVKMAYRADYVLYVPQSLVGYRM